MSPPNAQPNALPLANKLAAALASLSLALLAVIIIRELQVGSGGLSQHERRELKSEFLSDLANRSEGGIWDSHPDPAVGRVMQAGLRGKPLKDQFIDSNAFGMRDKGYILPKPERKIRIVCLGDSFVFGERVKAEERFGVKLEAYLAERAPEFANRLEVLHIGLGSWDILSETAYLRRQLSLLQPDLVIHLIVVNDLNDNDGIRGVGAKGNYSPRHRERADGRIYLSHPTQQLGFARANSLMDGRDHESRSRLEITSEAILKLAALVENAGGRYLLVNHWGNLNYVARQTYSARLRPEQVAYVAQSFASDARFWSEPDGSDTHWNAEGHTRIARMLYALIQERGLLKEVELPDWELTHRDRDEIHLAGATEAEDSLSLDDWFRTHAVLNAISFEDLNDVTAAQVYGGIDNEGFVGPYASVILLGINKDSLLILGRCLDRPELDGATVRVFVEEVEVGSFVSEAGKEIKLDFDIPVEIGNRPHINVHFEADDFVYMGDRLRHCVAFQLSGVRVRQRPDR